MTHIATRAMRAGVRGLVAATLALPLAAAPLAAQTDYYNTDAGRPITVEDAYPIERRALELQVAPLRLERTAGLYAWGIEPEIAVGILPRTQVELGLPLAWLDFADGQARRGLAGIELSALHNLNVETSIPAFALAAEVLLPAGPLGPERAYPSAKAIATKTLSWARFHVNGAYTFGKEELSGDEHAAAASELARWTAGLAVDRTFPLESFLVTGELVARQPMSDEADLVWDVAGGTRYQLDPRIALDAGAGYRLTGDDDGWFVTFGAAVALGLPWRAR